MILKKSWDVWCRSEPSARSTRLGSLPGAISHAASSLAGSLPRSGSVCAKEPSDGLPNFHFLKSVRMPTKNEKILPQAQRHEHLFSFDYLSLIFHEYFCKKKRKKVSTTRRVVFDHSRELLTFRFWGSEFELFFRFLMTVLRFGKDSFAFSIFASQFRILPPHPADVFGSLSLSSDMAGVFVPSLAGFAGPKFSDAILNSSSKRSLAIFSAALQMPFDLLSKRSLRDYHSKR